MDDQHYRRKYLKYKLKHMALQNKQNLDMPKIPRTISMSGGGPLDEVLDYYFSVHQDIQNIEIVSVEHQNIVQIFKKKLQPPPQQQSPPPPPLQPQQQSPPPPPSQPQPQPSVTWSVDTFELNPTKNNHPTNTNGATSYLKVSFTISYILDEEKQQIKKDIQEVINNALQDNQAIVQNLATNLVPEPQEYEITIINKKVFDEKDNIYKKLKSEINRFFPGAGPHTDVSFTTLKKVITDNDHFKQFETDKAKAQVIQEEFLIYCSEQLLKP